MRYYGTNAPVPAVAVTILNTPTPVVTGPDGAYASPELPVGSVGVYPRKTGDAGTAIGSLDASWALQAAVGSRTLSSAQFLAADVSGNGVVSSYDAALILQRVVGQRERFPAGHTCGSDWLFAPNPASVPNQVVFPPALGGGSCTVGAICYEPLAVPADGQDFAAILIGDVTGNWQPGQNGGLRTRDAAVVLGRPVAAREGGVRVPVRITRPGAYAATVEVRYDPAAGRFAGLARGPAAGRALVAAGEPVAGTVRLAVASAAPLNGTAGPVAVLRFAARDRAMLRPAVVAAALDEN